MTRAQYQKELEKLEREADKRGCCVIPAKPLREPKEASKSLRASAPLREKKKGKAH